MRVARERRHIRNNLPLRGVIVIAANSDDVEALEYLKGARLYALNRWTDVYTRARTQMSSCSLIDSQAD